MNTNKLEPIIISTLMALMGIILFPEIYYRPSLEPELRIQASQKADTNKNGKLEPAEALAVYRTMNFSPKRIISSIEGHAYESWLENKYPRLSTELKNLEIRDEHNKGRDRSLRHLATKALFPHELSENPSQKEAENYFQDMYCTNQVRILDLSASGETCYNISKRLKIAFTHPSKILDDSELAEYLRK